MKWTIPLFVCAFAYVYADLGVTPDITGLPLCINGGIEMSIPDKNPAPGNTGMLSREEQAWLAKAYPEPIQDTGKFMLSYPRLKAQQEKNEILYFHNIQIESYDSLTVPDRVYWSLYAPEIYFQSCSHLQTKNDKTLYIYYYGFPRPMEGFGISAKQYASLREKRSEVIELLKGKLSLLYDKDLHNIILDLNAIELLPYLLQKAGYQFNTGYNDESLYLSTIMGLLRQEKFAPVLVSGWEKEYHNLMDSIHGHKVLIPDSVPADERAWTLADPVHPVESRAGLLKYPETEENARRVVNWALQFLKEVPEKDWKKEKGMTAWPVAR